MQQQVDSLLTRRWELAVGLRQVAETEQASDDRDGRVGQAGESALRIAHLGAAEIFVVGEVAHIVLAVLDLLVVAQRGERTDLFATGLAGLDLVPLTFDADGLLAAVRRPDDPAVAGHQLERGGVSAHQCDPALPQRRDMPLGLA